MLNQIIVDYLKANKRLIIPEFGAFVRKDDQDMVVFIPFLKKDDGVFTTLVMNSCNMSRAAATELIDDYIFQIKQNVHRDGVFHILGLGTITKSDSDILMLKYNPNCTENSYNAVEGAQKPPISPLQSQVQEPSASKPVSQYTQPVRQQQVSPASQPTQKQQSSQADPQQVPPASQPQYVQSEAQRVQTEAQRTQQRTPIQGTPRTQEMPPRAQGTYGASGIQGKPEAQNTQSGTPRVQGGAQGVAQRIQSSQVPPTPSSRPAQSIKPPINQRPQAPYATKKRSTLDVVMMIAIISALLALAAMAYSIFSSSDSDMQLNIAPAQDSTVVEQSATPESSTKSETKSDSKPAAKPVKKTKK